MRRALFPSVPACSTALVSLLLAGVALLPTPARAADCAGGIIDTIAGGYVGDGGPGTEAYLYWPEGVAVGPDGSVYVADDSGLRVRRIDPTGVITTVAGKGVYGHSGDGGPATEACLADARDVALGPDGSLYIVDSDWVRKIDPDGIITTVAGGGYPDLGDGGPATEAHLNTALAVTVAADGSFYIADHGHYRIRRVDAAGIITTVAGTGQSGFSGDGGPAAQARLTNPTDVVVASDGSLYIADAGNIRIRKVDPAGIITTVAGNGQSGPAVDGVPATQTRLWAPQGVALGPDGSFYIADSATDRIRKVDPSGIITTVAGSGYQQGYSGDGGPATEARLYNPLRVAVGAQGDIYISDTYNYRIRRVDAAGIINTIGGNGQGGLGGDGGPAAKAVLSASTLALAADGSLYLSDTGNHRVRKIDPAGIITTVAGSGPSGWRLGDYSGDGGPATEARMARPEGIDVAPDGSLYIVDRENHRVRKVDPAGIITTVVGDGQPRFSGDGGSAAEASLNWPYDVKLGQDGSLYIVDSGNRRIRKVDPAGVITTFAGYGQYGYSGDGGPATEARMGVVFGLAVSADGSVYIADYSNNRVRKVDPAGIITTFAGRGPAQPHGDFSGDGGPATEAQLDGPYRLAFGPDGSLYIADEGNVRVRKVDPAGIITTVAGSGPWGTWAYDFSGDGGPATEARLSRFCALAVDGQGNIYIGDGPRVRKVSWAPCCSPVYEPGVVRTGDTVAIYANASGADGAPVTCFWDFGDGSVAGDCDCAHVYAHPGLYKACVVVTDDRGRSHTCCMSVPVMNRPPLCEITYSPVQPTVGDPVSFDSGAADPDGTVTSVGWDFGDGHSAAGDQVTHAYADAGEYTVCATVTDDQGVQATCCTEVSVAVGCSCDIAIDRTHCKLPAAGHVGQRKSGRIGAQNRSLTEPCDVVLRVTDNAGSIVFETTRRIEPGRGLWVTFRHHYTADEVGKRRWTWEAWPVDCEELTPWNNVHLRKVIVHP